MCLIYSQKSASDDSTAAILSKSLLVSHLKKHEYGVTSQRSTREGNILASDTGTRFTADNTLISDSVGPI